MKKSLILAAILIAALIAVPAFADTEVDIPHGPSSISIDDNGIIAGAIFDAPNLVGITKSFKLGVEGRKNLLNNPFDGDKRVWVDSNDGYAVFAKITFTGCLFRCDL